MAAKSKPGNLRIVAGIAAVALVAAAALVLLRPKAAPPDHVYVTRVEDGLPVFDVTVFHAPSYSVWLPTLIVHKGFDTAHGFRLHLTEKPGQSAYMDVASGTDYACLCIAPTTFTPFVEQGAKVTLLFNVFSYTNLVAVTDPRIKTAQDLDGRVLSTNTSTGNWAVSRYLLQQAGGDLSRIKVQSSAGGGAAVAELVSHQVDAILPGPVEVASLAQQTKDVRIFSIYDEAAWNRVAPGPGIPNVLLGVQTSWWKDAAHRKLAHQFYAAIQDAAAFAQAHPEDAAKIIGDNTDMPAPAVSYALTHYPDIIRIRPASDFKPSMTLITQKLMPESGSLQRPLTDAELNAYVSDFTS